MVAYAHRGQPSAPKGVKGRCLNTPSRYRLAGYPRFRPFPRNIAQPEPRGHTRRHPKILCTFPTRGRTRTQQCRLHASWTLRGFCTSSQNVMSAQMDAASFGVIVGRPPAPRFSVFSTAHMPESSHSEISLATSSCNIAGYITPHAVFWMISPQRGTGTRICESHISAIFGLKTLYLVPSSDSRLVQALLPSHPQTCG